MNIQSISFMGANPNDRNYKTRSDSKSKSGRPRQYTVSQDEYRPSRPHQKSARTSNRRRKQNRNKSAAGITATLAAIAAAVAIWNGGGNDSLAKVKFDGTQYSLTEIAGQYDCDEDIIKEYNGINDYTDLSSISEVLVPREYNSYINNEIEKLQESLYSSKLSDEERDETENKIGSLKEKKAVQDRTAKVYTDGKYIYYLINLTDENGEPLQSGINVETFKHIFDIKDGQIRKYNNLDYEWKKNPGNYDEDKGYFDYTGNTFHNGDVIKISVKGIDKKNID